MRAFTHLSLELVEELFILFAPVRPCAKTPSPPTPLPGGARGECLCTQNAITEGSAPAKAATNP